jgi:4-alpha-glucanotransferase
MSDTALKALARAAGLHIDWTDANGRPHEVKADTLRSVLSALGYPADTPRETTDSGHRLETEAKAIPQLTTAYGQAPVHVGTAKRARLRMQDGDWRDVKLEALKVGGFSFRAPDTVGYHELELDGTSHILAVAPRQCFRVADAAPARKLAGLSVQLYSLRGGHTEGLGDFAALAEFAAQASAAGIDAVAVSPTHARFAANPASISPYSPSSRFFLDPIYADPALAGMDISHPSDGGDLIDWKEVQTRKFAQLRVAYGKTVEEIQRNGSFRSFCHDGGQRLFDHALYEALDAHFRSEGKDTPKQWPHPFLNPRSREVQEFAERERTEIAFHLYLQWLTAQSAHAAQTSAKDRMAVGIIADMAVGLDRNGSHAWSASHELMTGLSIGAPPDVFNTAGQDWGLTTFSPAALRASGYESFIATLRAGMQFAGGIRIDHAMGLRRLWVTPEGASPADGVYLAFPLGDLLRLIALESVIHGAIVIGEDLGTVPEGFRAQIANAGILGMRVLWFERGKDGQFIPNDRWDAQAAALTTTHDLPTVAGWWCGRDIDWNTKVHSKTRLGGAGAERRNRKKDRSLLWSAFAEAGCAVGVEPPQEKPKRAVDAALSYVAKSPSPLAIAAVEDILALTEQPNLPGTIEQHPNWRRRLPPGNIWEDAKVQARVAKLTASRGK